MVERELTIRNKLGIHARPAALFVKTAGRFASDITVEKDGNRVSGKSIMGLMTLEGYQGSKLRIRAEGEDAEEAVQALEELVEKGFYED
ncbi:MAG TPA: HPr family phosphocarrier protein [Lentisphaerae bacterium]|nr:MAG: HPr family phosphocarrier protein [Verrucomicrobiota bacterium]HDL77213.1 HPr family phosphocarrier protein [Lentisphaerota bacterium]